MTTVLRSLLCIFLVFFMSAITSDAFAVPLQGPTIQPSSRPNGNTYWVVPGKLIAGEYPGNDSEQATRTKLRRYLDCGITFFLDLTQEGEKMPYESIVMDEAATRGVDVKYVRLPIQDFGIPTLARMEEILDAVDEANATGHSVYVHCRGGIGRTGTTVGCYLVRKGNTGQDALREVNRLFQNSGRSRESYRSPETDAQEAFVRGWHEQGRNTVMIY